MIKLLCRQGDGFLWSIYGQTFFSNADLRDNPAAAEVFLKVAKAQANAAVGRAITKTWS